MYNVHFDPIIKTTTFKSNLRMILFAYYYSGRIFQIYIDNATTEDGFHYKNIYSKIYVVNVIKIKLRYSFPWSKIKKSSFGFQHLPHHNMSAIIVQLS